MSATHWMGRALACVSAALAVAASACGKETSPAGAPTPPSAPGAAVTGEPGKIAESAPPAARITTKDLDAVTSANKPFKLALIVKTRNNPFFSPMIKAFETEVDGLRVQRLEFAPEQETDKEKQFNYVTTVASQGVDAILIAPADSKGIIPALKQAAGKNILIINLDNRVDPPEAAAQGLKLGGYVGADNEEGGRLAGDTLSQALGGKGEVAIIEGIRGADNAEARRRGFEAGAKGLTVVARETANWDTEQANAKMASILAVHPNLSGVFCANDMMAIGAMKAIKSAGKTGKIKVVGYDNVPAVGPLLQSGELYATIEQHPELMGKYGVKMAVGVLNGTVDRGRELLVPLEVIRGKQ